MHGIAVFAVLFGAAIPIRTAAGQTPGVAAANASLDRHADLSVAAASFADILHALRVRYGVRAIADDRPRVERTDLEIHGTLREVLTRIAGVFDYEWKQLPSGTLTFNRKFTDRKDLPQTVLPELQQTAKDILAIIPTCEPDYNNRRWGAILVALYDTMTDQEKAALDQGAEVQFSQLNPPQQMLLRRAIFTRAFGAPRAAAEVLAIQFASMTSSAIVVITQTSTNRDSPLPEKPRLVLHEAGNGERTARALLGRMEQGERK